MYEDYKTHLRKIADVNHTIAILQWDREINMPKDGAEQRAQQVATLSGLSHELAINEKYGQLLENLSSEKSLSEQEKRNVELSMKDFKKAKKYTTEFVQTCSKAVSKAYQKWLIAKTEKDFSIFAPALETLVQLKKEECKLVGFEEHPYDALLDQFEPGTKTSDINRWFGGVREHLIPFVKQISESEQVDDSFMYHYYNKEKQWDFSIEILKQMGYNFNAGRQDISPHPFTTSFGPADVRVTTRINENDMSECLWSAIHEGGHALYEQGLPQKNYGLPAGQAISLGIHESQSRLWENNVGRALPFWKQNFAKIQRAFPKNLGNVSLESFYRAMNTVKPSLIRTSADELTYHFHVMIRFEIEKSLIEGEVSVNDLPQLWNSKYKEYLGIDVPSDDKGVLQDIHWSYGSFGYFPTYSLGSFYAAQFFAKAKEDVTSLEEGISNGNTSTLLHWLRENIHQYGKFFSAEDLCKKITGKKLDFECFMEYAKNKYSKIYSLEEMHVF
ncbi:MAG: carboxypeptidase [Bacteroidetes bacterium]|nr:MAG: carboxypeptidase [Bacteroidota bacterium]